MYNFQLPASLLIALSVAACDPGDVDVNGNGNGHVNGNCNGKNNCNDTGIDSLDSGDSSDSMESTSDSDSTTDTTTTDTTTTDTTDSTDDSTESETGEPGLPGCGNGLPFSGDLCFLPTVQYAITNAQDAKIGDMNGDGHADVVVTTSTMVSVYRGDGTGALFPLGSVGAQAIPTHVALGDIDGDGDLDVAVNVANNARVRVYVNNGSGVLLFDEEYVVFSTPRGVLLADLDEDEDLELVCVHTYDKKVVVRKNDGLGNFGAQTAYDVEYGGMPGGLPESIYAADMDDDGAIDLVVGTAGNPVILYNYGNANFDGVGEQYVTTSTGLPYLAIEDYDLDGHLDIAGTRTSTGMVRVVYGTGLGMFHPMQLDFPTTVAKPLPLVSADFDGDGVPDLATGNEGSAGQIGILLGDGYGAFYDAEIFLGRTYANNITTGDLNEDGEPDIVMVSDVNTPGLSVLLSNP